MVRQPAATLQPTVTVAHTCSITAAQLFLCFAVPRHVPLNDCSFFIAMSLQLHANLALADELVRAAQSSRGRSNFPPRSANVLKHEQDYWGTMADGVKQARPEFEADSAPRVWDYTECMEVRECTEDAGEYVV